LIDFGLKKATKMICYNLTIMTETQPLLRDAIPLDETESTPVTPEEKTSTGRKIGLAFVILAVVGLIGFGFIMLLQPGTDTARVRDVFIIFMALEFLLIGIVMIILIVQLARLTLLLQNEIKPILDSTNETANTLRGTTAFLSEHLVEPVLKLNQYLAGLNRIVTLFKTDKK
jgi:hypothetical protein